MTDQQKSDREKSEQAWLMYCFQLPKKMPARHAAKQAIDYFKSSLKRDIEKRIDKLEELKRKRPDSINQNRIEELEYIIELIETVEP